MSLKNRTTTMIYNEYEKATDYIRKRKNNVLLHYREGSITLYLILISIMISQKPAIYI